MADFSAPLSTFGGLTTPSLRKPSKKKGSTIFSAGSAADGLPGFGSSRGSNRTDDGPSAELELDDDVLGGLLGDTPTASGVSKKPKKKKVEKKTKKSNSKRSGRAASPADAVSGGNTPSNRGSTPTVTVEPAPRHHDEEDILANLAAGRSGTNRKRSAVAEQLNEELSQAFAEVGIEEPPPKPISRRRSAARQPAATSSSKPTESSAQDAMMDELLRDVDEEMDMLTQDSQKEDTHTHSAREEAQETLNPPAGSRLTLSISGQRNSPSQTPSPGDPEFGDEDVMDLMEKTPAPGDLEFSPNQRRMSLAAARPAAQSRRLNTTTGLNPSHHQPAPGSPRHTPLHIVTEPVDRNAGSTSDSQALSVPSKPTYDSLTMQRKRKLWEEWLGVDAKDDSHITVFVDRGVASRMPPGWAATNDGRFIRTATDEIQDQHPAVKDFVDKVREARRRVDDAKKWGVPLDEDSGDNDLDESDRTQEDSTYDSAEIIGAIGNNSSQSQRADTGHHTTTVGNDQTHRQESSNETQERGRGSVAQGNVSVDPSVSISGAHKQRRDQPPAAEPIDQTQESRRQQRQSSQPPRLQYAPDSIYGEEYERAELQRKDARIMSLENEVRLLQTELESTRARAQHQLRQQREMSSATQEQAVAELRHELEQRNEQLRRAEARHREDMRAMEEQLRLEELRQQTRIAAAVAEAEDRAREQLAASQKSSADAMHNLKQQHQMELDSLRNLHQDEVSSLRSRATDATVMRGLVTQVETSTKSISTLQRRIQDEAEAAQQKHLAQLQIRERVVLEREERLEAERAHNENLLSTLASLRIEQKNESERLREEHARIQQLQSGMLSETSVLKEQLVTERERLQRERAELNAEKRTFESQKHRAEGEVQRQKAALQARVESSESQMAAMEKELDRLSRETEQQKDQLASARLGFAERERAIRAQETALERAQNDFNTQVEFLEMKMQEVDALSATVNEQSARVAQMYRVTHSEFAEAEQLREEGLQAQAAADRIAADHKHMTQSLVRDRAKLEKEQMDWLAEKQKILKEKESVHAEKQECHRLRQQLLDGLKKLKEKQAEVELTARARATTDPLDGNDESALRNRTRRTRAWEASDMSHSLNERSRHNREEDAFVLHSALPSFGSPGRFDAREDEASSDVARSTSSPDAEALRLEEEELIELEDTHMQVQAFLQAENLLPKGQGREFGDISVNHSFPTMHSAHTPARLRQSSTFVPMESLGKSLGVTDSYLSVSGINGARAGRNSVGSELMRVDNTTMFQPLDQFSISRSFDASVLPYPLTASAEASDGGTPASADEEARDEETEQNVRDAEEHDAQDDVDDDDESL